MFSENPVFSPSLSAAGAVGGLGAAAASHKQAAAAQPHAQWAP